MSRPRRRTIRVPAKGYQPTRAEMDEPVNIDRGDLTYAEAVQRLLRPVDVREVSAEEHRAERDRQDE